MKRFKNFETALRYYKKNRTLGDVVKIAGVIYTMQEYDFEGMQIFYGNKKHELGFIINTKNRYVSTNDATIEETELYERMDIYYYE